MKKNILLLLTVIPICCKIYGQNPSSDSHWQLIWEDEFNFLNTNIWKVQDNFDHYGELQVYKPNNVDVNNGNLVLTLKNESYSCEPFYISPNNCEGQFEDPLNTPYQYTSGWVETTQAYKVHYGYFETRMKLPYGYGFWPAWWTTEGVDPDYEELDIFEMIPGHIEYCGEFLNQQYPHNFNDMTSNIHSPGNGENFCDGYFNVNEINDYREWHVYGLEWSPSKIIWYVDNIAVRTVENNNLITEETMMVINFALNPNVSNSYNSADFPADMFVDYVRCYKLVMNCNENQYLCNYDFSNHDNVSKATITIGSNTCGNSLFSGDSVHLRATESISIEGSFSVPLGSEIYLDVNPCY